MRVNVSHITADTEVTEGDARKDGHCAVPFPAGDDLQQSVNTKQIIAAAEKVVQQVELADDVQQVKQFGGGVEKDEIVAASITADEVMQTDRMTDGYTLLTRVTACINRNNHRKLFD